MRTRVTAVGLAYVELMASLHGAAFEEPWSAVSLGELVAQPGVFALLAETGSATASDSSALGFILCRVAGGECELLTLAVRPTARRRGVATALLHAAYAKALADGAAAIFLEVAADNPAALGLYEREGFAPVGRRPAYYRDASGKRVEALVLRRRAARPSS